MCRHTYICGFLNGKENEIVIWKVKSEQEGLMFQFLFLSFLMLDPLCLFLALAPGLLWFTVSDLVLNPERERLSPRDK